METELKSQIKSLNNVFQGEKNSNASSKKMKINTFLSIFSKLRIGKVIYFIEPGIAIFLLLLVWEIVPKVKLVDPFLLSPFSLVVERLARLVANGKLFIHFVASFKRSFTGFSIAILFSIPVGFLIAWSKAFSKYADPVLQVFRSIPILALYPIFILFFGLGEGAKTGIIIYGTIWPTLLNTIVGVQSVDAVLIKSARSMSISKLGLFTKVVLPSALPSILTGIRLSAASSVLLLVAAEMLGAKKGLGFLIFYSEEKFDIPEMYGGILVLAIIGVSINYFIVSIEKLLTKWKQGSH